MLAALLLASLLDFGPERALAPRAEQGLAPRGRERARVATSDRGSLVVWSDGRTGAWNVYGARLDRYGTLLDPIGRVLASEGIAGDVVWTGRAYLVAYSVHPILYVRTVTPDGALGDPIPIVNTEWVEAHTVRLATDGSTVLLMTNSGRGAVLGLDGEKRRELNLGVLPRHEFSLDVAAAKEGYGLAYLAPEGIAFRRIRADREDAAQILPDTGGATTVALGSDGTSFLAVYDHKPGIVPWLKAQRVGDAASKFLTKIGGAYPTVVWRGGHYLVTFTRLDHIEVLALRVSAIGEPLGEATAFGTASAPSHADADRRPDGTGVAAWVSGHHRVEVGFFDTSDAAPSDVRPISFSAPEQRLVRVNANGGAVVTMWLEVEPFRREILLSRGIGGPAIVVASGEVLPVDVLIDGDVVWAVWSGFASGVRVRRYTTSLAPIDAAPLHVFPDADVRVAVGGGTLLLVTGGDTREPGLRGRVVREGNGTLAAEELFLPTQFVASRPAVAWDGSAFVVAWADAQLLTWYDVPVDEHLVVQRIGVDGAAIGARRTIDAEAGRRIFALEAARTGDDVALVWQTSQRATFIATASSSERHTIENPLGRKLDAITAIGENVLMLWTGNDTEYVLLSRELAAEERGVLPVAAAELDLASTGTTPVLAYARIAPEHGRVFRAFARTALTPRQHLVRR